MQNIAYILKFFLILLILPLTGCGEQIEFFTIDGKRHQSLQPGDEWLLVNFWAEWCKPCRQEVPELNRLHRSEGLQVLAISYDPVGNETIRKIAQNWGIQYPLVATSPPPIVPLALPQALPTSYLYGPDGKLRKKIIGEVSYEAVIAIIDTDKRRHSADSGQ